MHLGTSHLCLACQNSERHLYVLNVVPNQRLMHIVQHTHTHMSKRYVYVSQLDQSSLVALLYIGKIGAKVLHGQSRAVCSGFSYLDGSAEYFT